MDAGVLPSMVSMTSRIHMIATTTAITPALLAMELVRIGGGT
jgi:hypothetical protein